MYADPICTNPYQLFPAAFPEPSPSPLFQPVAEPQPVQEPLSYEPGSRIPGKSKYATVPKSTYPLELLYRMIIVVLRHPESNHQGMAFWKYAEKVYGADFFDYRGFHGLREKWKSVIRKHERNLFAYKCELEKEMDRLRIEVIQAKVEVQQLQSICENLTERARSRSRYHDILINFRVTPYPPPAPRYFKITEVESSAEEDVEDMADLEKRKQEALFTVTKEIPQRMLLGEHGKKIINKLKTKKAYLIRAIQNRSQKVSAEAKGKTGMKRPFTISEVKMESNQEGSVDESEIRRKGKTKSMRPFKLQRNGIRLVKRIKPIIGDAANEGQNREEVKRRIGFPLRESRPKKEILNEKMWHDYDSVVD